jgi:uncharacterized protein (TIGR02145 family)
MKKVFTILLFIFIIHCESRAQIIPQGFLMSPVIPSVVIGTQTWMLRNLDVSTFRNGEQIHQVVSTTSIPTWVSYGTNLTAAWVYNNYDANNNEAYGKLYNFYAVNDSRGICPVGWHVPSQNEWMVLVNYSGTDTSNGGKKLKESGTTHWASSSMTVATNTTGFTALGAGYMGSAGSSSGSLTYLGYFWTSTINGSTASYIHMEDNRASVNVATNGNMRGGFSVRCIHD